MFPTSLLQQVQQVLSQPFKRSQFGLFQGKNKQYGNNVPFSKHKSRRTWLPNVQLKRIPSATLGMPIRVKLTTRALKTIKKVVFSLLTSFCSNIAAQHGGLDKYVEKTPTELLGYEGMRIRLMLRDARKEAKDAKAARRKPPPEDSLLARRLDLFTQKRMLGARRITDRVRHTLDSARMAREEATKALGLTSLAR